MNFRCTLSGRPSAVSHAALPTRAMLARVLLTVAALIAVPSVAFGDCRAHFAGGVEPRSITAPATERPHLLCFTSYAVLESGATRTAVWSAESLTRDHILAARELTRDNTFHAEEAIAHDDRAELGDYARSGWDRGHMTPSGDMPDVQSQAESFSLANMIPQAPKNNRRLWEHIEASTRRLAQSEGQVYVVTGPGYTSAKPNLLNDRVRIPDLVWKAVYVPDRGAGAYVVRNDAGHDYALVSIVEITRITGVDPFPGLDASMRSTTYGLPSPTPHQGEGKDVQVAETTLLDRAAGETSTVASKGQGRNADYRDVQERPARESRARRQVDPSIDIVAVLESAITESGRILRRWLLQVMREALS